MSQLGYLRCFVPLPMPQQGDVDQSQHKNQSRRAQKSRAFFEKLKARKGGSGGSNEKGERAEVAPPRTPRAEPCLRSRSRGRSREKRRSRSGRRAERYYSRRPKDRALLLCRFDGVGCQRADCRYRHVRSFRGDFEGDDRRCESGNEGETSGGTAAARLAATEACGEEESEGDEVDEAELAAEAAQLEEYAEEVTEEHVWAEIAGDDEPGVLKRQELWELEDRVREVVSEWADGEGSSSAAALLWQGISAAFAEADETSVRAARRFSEMGERNQGSDQKASGRVKEEASGSTGPVAKEEPTDEDSPPRPQGPRLQPSTLAGRGGGKGRASAPRRGGRK